MTIHLRYLLVTLALPLCASLADAQFMPVNRRAAYVRPRSGFVPIYSSPYLVSPAGYGYYPYTYRNPVEGYLTGVADLLNAQGQYGLDYQSARLANQRVEQEKIRTRRMLLEQRRYEQSLKPTANEIREYRMREAERRALNSPPLPEILNADALNVLLTSIQKKHATGVQKPEVPLSPYVVSNINVTSGTGGNVGALKNGEDLSWTYVLRGDLFDEERERLEGLLQMAIPQARRGQVDVDVLRNLDDTLASMVATLKANLTEMSFSDYTTSKRFLDELKSAVRALKAPNAKNYFNSTWSARGETVGELVDYLTKNGLTFAPAVRGDETEYQALHHALVSYELALRSVMAKNQK